MPHAVADGAVIYASRDELGRMEMPQIVEAEAGEFEPGEPGQMVPIADVGRIQWAPIFADEQQPLSRYFAPRRRRCSFFQRNAERMASAAN